MDRQPPVLKTPGTGHVVMLASGFHTWARQFHAFGKQAQAVEWPGFTPVPYFMYCRSLELVLKAFLVTVGSTLDVLRTDFQHNLQLLLETATKRHLGAEVLVSPEWRSEVVRANKYYHAKQFEYFEMASVFDWSKKRLPSLTVLDEMCSTLLTALERRCLEWGGNTPKAG